MNSSKRKRHSLYFWIDIFFLSFPLILIVGIFTYFFISYTLASKELFISIYNFDNAFTDIFQYMFDNVESSFHISLYDDDGFLIIILDHCISWIFDFNYSSTFSNSILNFLFDVFDFLGFNYNSSNGYLNFYALILNYFTYIICYEFLSFFIQIVLWIPRYFKNKLYDRGLME